MNSETNINFIISNMSFQIHLKSFCAEKDQSLDGSLIQLLVIKNEINSTSLFTGQIKIRFLFDLISVKHSFRVIFA